MKISNLDEKLNLTFEIEGLLILARERGDSTPDEVFDMLRLKIAQLSGSETGERGICNDSENEEDAVAESVSFEEKADADNEPVSEIAIPPVELVAEPVSIRLDEKLARDGARDIRKAFTLNDRFRFRRELFSNSESRLNESLDIIAAMSSFDEAEDYFYNDLCWDRESDDVKDFMMIVANHFGADGR